MQFLRGNREKVRALMNARVYQDSVDCLSCLEGDCSLGLEKILGREWSLQHSEALLHSGLFRCGILFREKCTMILLLL